MKFSNMKLTIESISLMPATKDTSWDGSFVLLSIVGSSEKITRSYGRFLRDLKNSMLVPNDVETLDDPRILNVLRPILEGGATITGYFRYVKEGQKFIVDENHPAITSKNHPRYGVWSIDEEYSYDKDAIHIDGFMIINYGGEVLERISNSTAYALAKVKPVSAFSSYKSTDLVDDQVEEVEEVVEVVEKPAKVNPTKK